MKKRLLFLLILPFIFNFSGCPPSGGSGCNFNYCCVNGIVGTPFVAIYQNGSIYRGTIGQNGVGTYPLPTTNCPGPSGCGPACSLVLIHHGFFFGFTLTAEPEGIDLQNPPESILITGQGIDNTYGPPMIEYFNSYGYLVGSVAAEKIGADGSWGYAPVPDLSSVYSGSYQVRVTNMTASGYYLNIVGTATINTWGRDRPDSDGDGWYDDEDCYPDDPSRWTCWEPPGGCLQNCTY
jgi:hypothetical protein